MPQAAGVKEGYYQKHSVGGVQQSCPSCLKRGSWFDYFCPHCDTHDDRAYNADRLGEPILRPDIVVEYRRAGMHGEADRLAQQGPWVDRIARPRRVQHGGSVSSRPRADKPQRRPVASPAVVAIERIGGPARMAQLLGVSEAWVAGIVAGEWVPDGWLTARLERLADEHGGEG